MISAPATPRSATCAACRLQVMKIDRSLPIDAVSPTGRAILAAMVELLPANWAWTASPRA